MVENTKSTGRGPRPNSSPTRATRKHNNASLRRKESRNKTGLTVATNDTKTTSNATAAAYRSHRSPSSSSGPRLAGKPSRSASSSSTGSNGTRSNSDRHRSNSSSSSGKAAARQALVGNPHHPRRNRRSDSSSSTNSSDQVQPSQGQHKHKPGSKSSPASDKTVINSAESFEAITESKISRKAGGSNTFTSADSDLLGRSTRLAPLSSIKRQKPSFKGATGKCCRLWILGSMSNSFFAKRLAFVTLVIVAIDGMGLYLFYTNYRNIADFVTPPENSADLELEGCKNTTIFSLLVYHGAVLSFIVGLPSSGFRIFELFSRTNIEQLKKSNTSLDGKQPQRRKIKRTLFLQFCELLIIIALLYILSLTGYMIYMSVDYAYKCEEIVVWIFAFFAFLVYVLVFVQVTYFTRFREHLKMQLGVFKEKDQTGNIRSRVRLQREKWGGPTSAQNQIIRQVRKRIYTAVELGDLVTIESTLNEAQHRLGVDFAEASYKTPKMWFGLFAKSTKNPLHLAALLGDVPALKLLYTAGFEINSMDKVNRVRFSTGDLFWYLLHFFVKLQVGNNDGSKTSMFHTTLLTPLHCAAATGRVEAVRWLIQHGANVNVISRSSNRSDRFPPLFMVDNPQVAEDLLIAGANHLHVPDPGYMNTITALELAYVRENYSVARVLEEWGGDVALTPLHAFAAGNNSKQVLSFLKSGTDPNCLGEQGYVGMNRRTPLHWAATMGCPGTCQILLDYNADPNAVDRIGRTPLHWAARKNELGIIQMLMEYGAEANATDHEDMTPIICAATAKDISKDVILELVNRGADVNYQLPQSGDTALHIAMKMESRGTALSLLDCGADIQRTNADGFRPVDCTTSTELQFAVKKAAGNRDVMISYTHSHVEFAMKIRKSLEAANVTTWLDLMDPTGIGGGSVWREEIARGIANAAVVLCLLTKDYPESEWCLKELAYAKQVGTPVIALSSENVAITEDLQVYLYTRQIVPFENAITQVHRERSKTSKKVKISYTYDDYKYATQFRSLLDGVRDEIEKMRQAGIQQQKLVGESNTNSDSNGTTAAANIVHSFDPESLEKQKFIFLSHGNCHPEFVVKMYNDLSANGVLCYVDQVLTGDFHAAKNAILNCACFVVILSDLSARNELVNDQLAFAEDKEIPILPILLSEPQLGMGQQYTLSRNRIFHFTSGIGFVNSFRGLLGQVHEHCPASGSSRRSRGQARSRTNSRSVTGNLSSNSSSLFRSILGYSSFISPTSNYPERRMSGRNKSISTRGSCLDTSNNRGYCLESPLAILEVDTPVL